MNIAKLIELVKEQPVLYDKNHRCYSVVNVKTVVWRDIGRILSAPAQKCKLQWQILRNRYLTEKRKAGNKNWKYFKNMTFLDAYLRTSRVEKHSNVEEINANQMDDSITPDESIDFDKCFEKNSILTTPRSKSRASDVKQKTENVSNIMCKNPITDFKRKSNNAVNLYCESMAKTIIDEKLTSLQFLELQEKLLHTLKIALHKMQ